ncbi:MAG: amidohydrolase [Amphiplicatus sp.]
MRRSVLSAAAVILALAGCGKKDGKEAAAAPSAAEGAALAARTEIVRPPLDPYPSTYEPYPSETMLIAGATILTGTGARLDNGAILIEKGKIAAVGPASAVAAPEGARRIEAAGKWATPGLIDIHSHLGDYPSPATPSNDDGNEMTDPNTAEAWAEHSVWPQDAGFTRALAGGITTLQILPGSANLFGGRSVVLKNVPSRTVQGMKFPGAKYGLKMACGENPKRVYAARGPSTRMGNFAGYRAAWIEAAAYKKKWEDYWRDAEAYDAEQKSDKDSKKGAKSDEGKRGGEKDESKPPEPPKRDLELETLAGALKGDILVDMHCYRADEMAQVLDMAKEFGYKVASFHHAVEAYKIADILAREGVCAAMWADWWGFKLEAYDAIRENIALVDAQPNSCAVVHSDDPLGIQRLNQEAAKAMADGNRLGLKIKEERAIAWLTANPAKAIGVLDRTGTLEAGKMADVVIWSGNPFSVYAKAERVYIDGALLYDRTDPARSPRMDFEIGQPANGFTGGSGQ